MKLNKIGYLFKEGVCSVFNHGFMSFASVFIIVACLLIIGSFSLLAININNLVKTLEDQNQIIAFVSESLTDDEAKSLEEDIESLSYVSSAQFVSRDEAMDSFVSQYEDTTLLEDLDSTVLRHRYIVYLDDISQMGNVQKNLLSLDGIAKVNAHIEIAKGFVSVRNVVTAVSITIAAVLLIVSLFIISNTIKLTTFDRREEIAIMKMVGATSGFIRWPFVVEGLMLGMFGSLAAYIAQWGLYQLVSEQIVKRAELSFLEAIPFSAFSVPLLVAFCVIGVLVGALGSSIAIKNYLKV